MNLTILSEERFARTPDGGAWTRSPFDYKFWSGGLTTFDEIHVVARISDCTEAPELWRRVDGPQVTIKALPYYHGSVQFLSRMAAVRQTVCKEFLTPGALLLRLPAVAAGLGIDRLHAARRCYAVEVLGDPNESLARGAITHPLRPLIRALCSHSQRRLCQRAAVAGYSTEDFLQRRYPCAGVSMFVHDVTLPTAAFRDAPRRLEAIPRPLVLISVATLDQIYKGQDLLIDAVARCVRESFDLRLVFVGDGKFRSTLEHHARQQGVGGRVVFKGHVPPGEALWSELDAADLFVLPSKADALPKAVVEAMARALPCIGSTVGEFPRLLAPEDLVRPNDLHSLVATLQAVAGAPQRMTAMSARNLQNARRFHIDQVSTMRTAFYREVREKTKASGSAGGGRIS